MLTSSLRPGHVCKGPSTGAVWGTTWSCCGRAVLVDWCCAIAVRDKRRRRLGDESLMKSGSGTPSIDNLYRPLERRSIIRWKSSRLKDLEEYALRNGVVIRIRPEGRATPVRATGESPSMENRRIPSSWKEVNRTTMSSVKSRRISESSHSAVNVSLEYAKGTLQRPS